MMASFHFETKGEWTSEAQTEIQPTGISRKLEKKNTQQQQPRTGKLEFLQAYKYLDEQKERY